MAVIFIPLFIMFILGMPIAFSILTSSVIFLLVNNIPISIAVQRTVAGADSFPLLAIPFFILAGVSMNSGGITKRIFHFADVLVGHVTGGLGHANVLASVIFAGMSGSALADAGGLGAVEIEAMREAGYDDDITLSVTGASSIIGPIIPPSIIAVVFAVSASVSLGRVLVAGIVPGVFMAIVMCIIVYFQCKARNYPKRKRATFKEILLATKEAILPLMAPVILVGGITFGVFTPTEAAIVAVVYGIIVSFFYKAIKISDIWGFLVETGKMTANVMFLVASASIFGWVIARAGVPQALTQFFLTFIHSKVTAILVINVFLLIVGMLMDNSAAVPIMTPVLMPVAVQYGIDPVHFGIIMIVNLMIGLLTPPVGMVVVVLQGITNIPYEKIFKCLVPYMVALTIALLIIAFVPSIALTLPNLIFGMPK